MFMFIKFSALVDFVLIIFTNYSSNFKLRKQLIKIENKKRKKKRVEFSCGDEMRK